MNQQQKTILVVETEKDVADALCERLCRAGEVCRAAGVEEALEILKNRRVDLVLSESRLPGIAVVDLVGGAESPPSDSSRLLLTGRAQLIAAAEALCKGSAPIPHGTEGIEMIVLAALSVRLQQCAAQQQELEKQLVQLAKMASLGELVAGIMHEINNPLAFISANLGNLLKFCKRLTGLIDGYEQVAVSDEVRKAFEARKEEVNFEYIRNRITEMIEQSMAGADRTKKIIQDVKSFSRLNTAGFVEADIHEAIDSTLTMLYHEYKGRIEIDKQYGVIPPVKCNIAKLSQVFMNLLVNAIQAIEGPGVIGIRTGREGGMVVIEISDTGCGIPDSMIDKVFDQFYTTKPVGVGTGLGLSIIRGIIEQHKGALSVRSTLGQGTTFTIKVPIDLKAEDEKDLSNMKENGYADH